MKKTCLLMIISILNLKVVLGQTELEIDSLLNGILKTENSINIKETEQARKIIAYGDKSLPILAELFTESISSEIKSICNNRNLTKGELAIIIADRIKGMPYFKLTGMQNCLSNFCENNPNLIEYYLMPINRDGIERFQKKYKDWLSWRKLSDKEKRKLERINNRKYKKLQREIKNTSR